MRIDVIGRHLEVTPAIQKYAESKAEKLLKIFDGTQQIRICLESPQGKASQFHVEVAVDVVKHKDFIANAIEADLYAAIDTAVDKALRQLRDFKERLPQVASLAPPYGFHQDPSPSRLAGHELSQIVPEGAIVARLTSLDRDAVVGELLDSLIAGGAATASLRPELITRVLERERRGSTGFGKGIAVPHVKHKSVKSMAAAIGLSTQGIDFNALDRQPVYSVFFLLSPEDKPEEHLQAMEVIFKNLSKDTFRRFLRQAATAEDVRTLLEETDGQ